MSIIVDMNSVNRLCKDIQLQSEVYENVIKFIETYNFDNIKDILINLTNHLTGFNAYEQLKELFLDDPTKMLAAYLVCATNVREKYKEKGIDDKIFIDTMGCFTRFTNECKVKTGVYAFDRAYWTYRQLSMVIFRIKTLEFEFKDIDNKKFIKIHIPSDSKFTKENVDASIKEAKNFINKYFKEYNGCDFVCDSWLLSLKLREFLDKESNILNFQDRFDIIKQDYEAKEFILWLFQTHPNTDITKLKENTSLQKKVKKFLLEGGNIGSGYGVLK